MERPPGIVRMKWFPFSAIIGVISGPRVGARGNGSGFGAAWGVSRLSVGTSGAARLRVC
jgi:hypothetical protein